MVFLHMSNSDWNTLTRHYTPCLTLIRAIYPQLTQSERIVADYILQNPGSVLRYSIAEVGKQSGVGLATVNRLCTKLNYRSYSDMKIALAIELLNPDNTVPDPVSPDDDAATLATTLGRLVGKGRMKGTRFTNHASAAANRAIRAPLNAI